MGHLLRSAVVLVAASLAAAAIAGCNARLAEPADRGVVAEAGTSDGDVISSTVPLDAGGGGDALVAADAAPNADAASDATGPKICNPQDTRYCEVATAAEGAACPMSFDDAKAAFTCANYPVGSYYVVGGCGSYLYASIESAGSRQAVQCLYDPGSHALVASDGYDDCGAFCGGINHVHWGVGLSPCGITPDTAQGSCNADAGADGG